MREALRCARPLLRFFGAGWPAWPLVMGAGVIACGTTNDVGTGHSNEGPGGGGQAPLASSGTGGAGAPSPSGGGSGATAGSGAAGSSGAGASGTSTSGGGSGGNGGTAGTAGSSAGSAGSAGAAGSDKGSGGSGGSGGSSAGCVTSGQELCDDFESGQLDPQKWKLNKPSASASITIDGEHVHSGQHAVHIKIAAGQQSTAMLTEAVTFPAPTNSFYARAFMYFTPDLPTAPGADFHMGFILGIGKNDLGDVQAGTGMIGGAAQYLGYSIFFGPPKYEFGPWSKAKVLPSTWQCVELFEDGSSPTEEKRQVWLDGAELMDLRSTSNGPGAPANHKPPAFNGVSFGVWEYHPSPLLSDIWLDDIRVSATPIGCN